MFTQLEKLVEITKMRKGLQWYEHKDDENGKGVGFLPLVLAICSPVLARARAHHLVKQAIVRQCIYYALTSSLDSYTCL